MRTAGDVDHGVHPLNNYLGSWKLEVGRWNWELGVGSWALSLLSLCLHFVHHAQQIAAPDLGDLRLCVSAPHEFERDVERFVGAVPAVHAAAAVEIRRDSDMIDAD